jgi:hypothetical protein
MAQFMPAAQPERQSMFRMFTVSGIALEQNFVSRLLLFVPRRETD